jgi:hypothetical protein
MTVSRPIKVMISSRCTDRIPLGNGSSVRLTDLREAIKERLQDEMLCKERIFRVDITPEHPASGADDSFWAQCLRVVREADIVLVLYNGDAGYAHPRGHLGICEAEYNEAMTSGGCSSSSSWVAARRLRIRPGGLSTSVSRN